VLANGILNTRHPCPVPALPTAARVLVIMQPNVQQKQVGRALEGRGFLAEALELLDIVAEQNNKAVVGVTRPSCTATRLQIRHTSPLEQIMSLTLHFSSDPGFA